MPPKPTALDLVHLQIKLTKAESTLCSRAAHRAELNRSQWAREVLIEAARKLVGNIPAKPPAAS